MVVVGACFWLEAAAVLKEGYATGTNDAKPFLIGPSGDK